MIHSLSNQSQLTPLLKGQEGGMSSAFHQDATSAFPMLSFTNSAPIHDSAANFDPNSCRRCAHPGVDVKLMDCGCSFHARCTPVSANRNLGECPSCHSPVRSVLLMPMNFDEIDAAKAAAATMAPSAKRGKKRKNATIARLNPHATAATPDETGEGSDLRTGRWTTEETLYCDKMIDHFESGSLPISDGIKLNDFLANMLKSKQSRLTKKMKNAKLSSKAYKHGNGFIASFEEAKEFSALEKSFYDSIPCDLERAEIRFHMQKEWREQFSTFCSALGQKLDADTWLSSVEEMDRRISQAKDAARMARRKIMMGCALSQDSMNQEQGVFIDNPTSTDSSSHDMLSGHHSNGEPRKRNSTRSLRDFSSPFVGKVIQYMDRHQIPFEHVDAWVPSFIPTADQAVQTNGEQQKCRLCFAGFATTDFKVPADGGRAEPMNSQDQFDLLSFGEYSSKFSFDVGCGLPGRVYSSGICSWEQGIANAPSHQFERCGGASQWGIKTVLGIPIPSPNVGRIVVLLYSRHDRLRDADLVRRITDELTKLMPTPKWKLVVDIGATPPTNENGGRPADTRIGEVLNLLADHMPTHHNSPHSPYRPGFEALRQLLLKQEKSKDEEELMNTTLDSYSSYLSSGRRKPDVAWMIARDYMFSSPTQYLPQQTQMPSLNPLQMGTLGMSTSSSQQYSSHLQPQGTALSHQVHASTLTLGGIMPHLQQKASTHQNSGTTSSATAYLLNGTSNGSAHSMFSAFQSAGHQQPPTSSN